MEVGVASFGAPECCDASVVHDLVTDDRLVSTEPAWRLVETPIFGGIAMCTVGPQHQLCLTWLGIGATGSIMQLVTDLGLLALDLDAGPEPPW